MIHLETRAMNCLEIVESYHEEVICKDNFKKIYSDIYGNLHEGIAEIKIELSNGLNSYKEKKRKNKNYGTAQTQMDYDEARSRLERAMNDFNELWIKEILPSTQNLLKELPSKIEHEDIKLPPNEKNDMLEKANKTLNLMQKVAKTGKKVWETVKEYKGIIISIGKFFL